MAGLIDGIIVVITFGIIFNNNSKLPFEKLSAYSLLSECDSEHSIIRPDWRFHVTFCVSSLNIKHFSLLVLVSYVNIIFY